MRLRIELEGQPVVPHLPGDGAALIAFMSFAVSRGFGATHPLIALADRLHDTHRVRLGPLTTFYEAEAEDAEDREKLELAWQEPKPLRESLEALLGAIETDEGARVLLRRGDAETLPEQAAAARDQAKSAEKFGCRVRLVYSL